MNGFSLVELMLSLSLGLTLSGVMLQGLMAEGQNGARFSRLLRERAWQQRTFDLLKSDLAIATAFSAPSEEAVHSCNLAGRLPVLRLSTPSGSISYSVGAAPSSIWRGQVLMRCGPAYGIDGVMRVGSVPQNRVVIDGLVQGNGVAGFEMELDRSFAWVRIKMVQSFVGHAMPKEISMERIIPLQLLTGS